MAKKAQIADTKKNSSPKKTFEERLVRLEELGDEIRKNDIPLEDAIKSFEEGIALARALEKDLEKIESRIEILMNGTELDSSAEADDDNDDNIKTAEVKPKLGLFDDAD
jgi:exodeoxyribonuclease VII small subunit